MKRIILSVIVMAFAVAVQAGDAKVSQNKENDKPACCDKDKSACSASKLPTAYQTEASCPFAKSACCSKKASVKQTALLSPKAADAAR